jgi:hypothetical protein
MTGEFAALLASARTAPSSASSGRLSAPHAGFDWSAFTRLAQRHEVVPLVYSHWKRYCPDFAPSPVMSEFASQARANGQQNIILTGALVRLLEAFQRAGIVAVPYKGPVLALSAYGDSALRQCCDLDVMLRPEDVWRAAELAAGQGYEPVAPLPAPADRHGFLATRYHIEFVRADRLVHVELHWSFSQEEYRAALDTAPLWTRLSSVRLAGVEFPAFAPEDLLLVLCLHGAKHAWRRLKWICDVSELRARHPDLDVAVHRAARQAGSERIVALGVGLAADLLGASPWKGPPLQDSALVAPLVVRIREQLALERVQPLESLAVLLASRQTPAERRRLLTLWIQDHIKPTDKDRSAVALPRALSWLYYVIRPIRLLGQYSWKPLRHLAGGLRR